MPLDMARCPEGEQNHPQWTTAALDPLGDPCQVISAPPALQVDGSCKSGTQLRVLPSKAHAWNFLDNPGSPEKWNFLLKY